MRSWLVIATVGAALLATSAQAQRGGHASFAAPRAVAARPAAVAHAPLGFTRSNASGYGRGYGYGHGYGYSPYSYAHGRFGWRNGYYNGYNGYNGYYPGYWGPLWWDTDQSYDLSDQSDQQNAQLQQEVDSLQGEVQGLREQEDEARSGPAYYYPPPSYGAPPPPMQSAPPPAQSNTAPRTKSTPEPPTTLVFRSGKTEEVQNYAIVDHTMWVLNERLARKIPLSDLDIPATEKANDESGVGFEIPSTH